MNRYPCLAAACLSGFLLAVPAFAQTINPNQIRPCPVNGQVLTTVAGVTSCATPQLPITITSFAGGSTVEIGQVVVNPTFTAAYSSAPTSASIANNAGIDTPLQLSTPFMSGTFVGGFTEATASSVTFTLTAMGVNTATATQNINWDARPFGGVGAAAATGTVTSSGNTAVLSNGAVLASGTLSNSQAGQVFGAYTASAQKVYLLLIGASHTFKDNSTGLAFAFNTPTAVTFTNQFGIAVTMYLYESTNTLTGTFNVLVVS